MKGDNHLCAVGRPIAGWISGKLDKRHGLTCEMAASGVVLVAHALKVGYSGIANIQCCARTLVCKLFVPSSWWWGVLSGAYETYLPGFSLDGSQAGSLVAHSKQPLVDAATCDAIVEECEERGAQPET